MQDGEIVDSSWIEDFPWAAAAEEFDGILGDGIALCPGGSVPALLAELLIVPACVVLING